MNKFGLTISGTITGGSTDGGIARVRGIPSPIFTEPGNSASIISPSGIITLDNIPDDNDSVEVIVKAENDDGEYVKLSKTRTAEPGPTPLPSWSVAPSISGIFQVGETLTGDPGTIVDGTLDGVEWLLNGTPIPGETGLTYDLDPVDEDQIINFRPTATGPGGTNSATSPDSPPIAAAAQSSVFPSPTATDKVFGRLSLVGAGGRVIPHSGPKTDGGGSPVLSMTDPTGHWKFDPLTGAYSPKNGVAANGTAWVANPNVSYELVFTDSLAVETYTLTVPTVAGVACVSTHTELYQVGLVRPQGTTIYCKAGTISRLNVDQRLRGGPGNIFSGSNWTIVTHQPEDTADDVLINCTRIAAANVGMKFVELNFGGVGTTPGVGGVVNAVELIAGGSNAWFEDCTIDGQGGLDAGATEVQGLFGPWKQLTARNLKSINTSYVIRNATPQGLDIDGYLASVFYNDPIQFGFSESSTSCNASIRNYHSFDVVAFGESHADFTQIDNGGTTGATIPGETVIENSTYTRGPSTFGVNFIVGNSAGITNAIHMEALTVRRVGLVGTNDNGFACSANIDQVTLDGFMAIPDFNNPFNSNTICEVRFRFNRVKNVLIRRSIVSMGEVSLAPGFVPIYEDCVFGPFTTGRLADMFEDPFSATAGGTGNHGNWQTVADANAEIAARYNPKIGSELDMGDGRWIGPRARGGKYNWGLDTDANIEKPTGLSPGATVSGVITLSQSIDEDAVFTLTGDHSATVTITAGSTVGNFSYTQPGSPSGLTISNDIGIITESFAA